MLSSSLKGQPCHDCDMPLDEYGNCAECDARLDAEDGEPKCTSSTGHEFVYTGTSYGGDDESYCGEGRCYCRYCGADGDA